MGHKLSKPLFDKVLQLIAQLEAVHGKPSILNRMFSAQTPESAIRGGSCVRFSEGSTVLDIWATTGSWHVFDRYTGYSERGSMSFDHEELGRTMLKTWRDALMAKDIGAEDQPFPPIEAYAEEFERAD